MAMSYKTYTCPIERSCGGCELLAVPYPIQLRRKTATVEELFGEFFAADGTEVGEIRGMEPPLYFRYKAATPFAPGRRGRGIRSGFYRKGTHQIVATETCFVEHPVLRPLLNRVAESASKLKISAYDENRGRGSLRHAIARVSLSGEKCLLTLVTNGQELRNSRELVSDLRSFEPRLIGVVQNINQRQTNAMLGSENKLLWGKDSLRENILGCSFLIGSQSFFQTNPKQTEVLYQLAKDYANLQPGERMLDAYCGTGSIGICLAAGLDGVQLVGVEKVADAVARAKENAKLNELSHNTHFICADASSWIVSATRRSEHFDLVVMDPPRAGASEEFIAALLALEPSRIVYISCNPTTQLRDCELLRQAGYVLSRYTPVDMFPHTKHVEAIALLTRK